MTTSCRKEWSKDEDELSQAYTTEEEKDNYYLFLKPYYSLNNERDQEKNQATFYYN